MNSRVSEIAQRPDTSAPLGGKQNEGGRSFHRASIQVAVVVQLSAVTFGQGLSEGTQVRIAISDDSSGTAGNEQTQSGFVFHPRLRGVQVDGVVFLAYAYGGSLDLDFFRFATGRNSSLGIRAGVERFSTGGPAGETGGSPYLDYNALLRVTLPGERFRFDAFLGFAYHTSDHPEYHPSEGLVKYGAELRYKIASGTFGLLAKVSGTEAAGILGIGLYLGWDQKEKFVHDLNPPLLPKDGLGGG